MKQKLTESVPRNTLLAAKRVFGIILRRIQTKWQATEQLLFDLRTENAELKAELDDNTETNEISDYENYLVQAKSKEEIDKLKKVIENLKKEIENLKGLLFSYRNNVSKRRREW